MNELPQKNTLKEEEEIKKKLVEKMNRLGLKGEEIEGDACTIEQFMYFKLEFDLEKCVDFFERKGLTEARESYLKVKEYVSFSVKFNFAKEAKTELRYNDFAKRVDILFSIWGQSPENESEKAVKEVMIFWGLGKEHEEYLLKKIFDRSGAEKLLEKAIEKMEDDFQKHNTKIEHWVAKELEIIVQEAKKESSDLNE